MSRLAAFLLCVAGLLNNASAQQLTLPVYELTIDNVYLDLLYKEPDADIYYPAVFKWDTITYTCKVKFKGASSLNYPKKSWAIKFEDANNIFKAIRINLNGDYKDHSNLRNFLVLKLFDSTFQTPRPDIGHVSFKVNGKYAGVFTFIEQMDEYFLKKRGLPQIDFYKANNHGAGMLAITRDDYWDNVWTERVGNDNYADLKELTNKLMYWNTREFDSLVNTVVNVDNALSFFAVHFANTAFDNFNKNKYINLSQNGQYEWIPWDNEGSFGFGAFGDFDTTHFDYNLEDSYTGEYNVLLQRLLDNPTYRALFQTKVNKVINQGYSYLESLITTESNRIRNDVYLDTTKETSNAEFEADLDRLRLFMSERRKFLSSSTVPVHQVLTDFYCSNPFPTVANPIINFQVTSKAAQRVFVFFADSVSFNIFGKPFKLKRIELYDDGLHNDALAGDLVYGNTANASMFSSDIVPYSFTGGYQNYPSNGLFYVDYYQSKSFAINKANANAPNLGARLKIGRSFKQNEASFIEVYNASSSLSTSLGYCHFRVNSSWKDVMFLHDEVLLPNDTLILTNDSVLAQKIFPGRRICNVAMYFDVEEMDLLEILGPDLSPITSKSLISFTPVPFPAYDTIVINEINYNSPVNRNGGDWIELYNPNQKAVNVSGWVFRDLSNLHTYVIPEGTTMPANSYLVICEDTIGYTIFNNTNVKYLGNLGFGLSGAGELIRLFNNNGQLVDSVWYDDNVPWPTAADGNGPTLELRNYAYDNAQAASWYTFAGDFGTPGQQNHLTNVGKQEPALSDLDYFTLYPNPARGNFTIALSKEVEELEVSLMSLIGTMEGTWKMTNTASMDIILPQMKPGVYVVTIKSGLQQVTRKLVVQ